MLWLAQWYADKKSNFLKFLQQQGSNPVLQTFFLIFMIFYIFEGCFAREIPFYVNLLTKLRKKENFVSTAKFISAHVSLLRFYCKKRQPAVC